jgi:hypothetical protein
MKEPWCTRCTRKCSIQHILDNFDSKVEPETVVDAAKVNTTTMERLFTEDQRVSDTDLAEKATYILGKYAARGLFVLPKKRPKETPNEDDSKGENAQSAQAGGTDEHPHPVAS